MSGSTPVHTSVRYSYLSSDSIWLAKHDGLLNLAVIILIAANFRCGLSICLRGMFGVRGGLPVGALPVAWSGCKVAGVVHTTSVLFCRLAACRLLLENLLKYGWRLNFISYIARSLAGRGNLPLVLAFPALVALSLLALASEKLGRLAVRAEEQVRTRSCVNSSSSFVHVQGPFSRPNFCHFQGLGQSKKREPAAACWAACSQASRQERLHCTMCRCHSFATHTAGFHNWLDG